MYKIDQAINIPIPYLITRPLVLYSERVVAVAPNRNAVGEPKIDGEYGVLMSQSPLRMSLNEMARKVLRKD